MLRRAQLSDEILFLQYEHERLEQAVVHRPETKDESKDLMDLKIPPLIHYLLRF